MAEPFIFDVRPIADRLIEINYAGHLGVKDTEPIRQLDELLAARDRCGIYVEVPLLTGFDRAQVKMHADVFLRHAAKIAGIGLVGASAAVRFAAVTVGLITKLKVQTFDDRRKALTWLATLKAPRR